VNVWYGFRFALSLLLRGVSNCEIQAGFGASDGSSDGGGVGLDSDGFRVGGGQLKAVEKDCGALGVDAVAGEGGDEQGDGDLDGFGVFDGREVELDWILSGVIGQVLGRSGCGCGRVGAAIGQGGGVFDQVPVAPVEARVEVAEGGETEGRAADASCAWGAISIMIWLLTSRTGSVFRWS